MRYLLRADTRRERWRVLTLRVSALRVGDDFYEMYLACAATVYGVVMLLPGDTTGHATSWRVMARLLHDDLGIGVLFCVFAVALWLSALRLVGERVQQYVALATLCLWMGMAVGFFFGYWLAIGPYLSLLNAFAAWLIYLHAEAP